MDHLWDVCSWAYDAMWKQASGAPVLGGASAFMLSPRQKTGRRLYNCPHGPNAPHSRCSITAVG